MHSLPVQLTEELRGDCSSRVENLKDGDEVENEDDLDGYMFMATRMCVESVRGSRKVRLFCAGWCC